MMVMMPWLTVNNDGSLLPLFRLYGATVASLHFNDYFVCLCYRTCSHECRQIRLKLSCWWWPKLWPAVAVSPTASPKFQTTITVSCSTNASHRRLQLKCEVCWGMTEEYLKENVGERKWRLPRQKWWRRFQDCLLYWCIVTESKGGMVQSVSWWMWDVQVKT